MDLAAGSNFDELNGWILGVYSPSTGGYYYLAGFPVYTGTSREGAFSASGNAFIVYDTGGNTVTVWDKSSPSILRVIGAPMNGVSVASLHPGGRLLAIGSLFDGYVDIWNLATLQHLRTFNGPPGQIASLAFSANGKYLEAGSSYGQVVVWNYSSMDVILSIRTGEDWVTSAAFDPDANRLALGMGGFHNDTSVQVWDLATGTRLWGQAEHSATVKYAAFNPDGRLLASADDSGGLVVWNASSGEALNKLAFSSPLIAGLSFSSDGKLLLLGTEAGELLTYAVPAE